MFRAVIFDFDGVITDSEILHYRAFNLALAKHGVEITKKDYYKKYLGLTDLDFFKELAAKNILHVTEAEMKNLLVQKNHSFEHLAQTGGHIIDGVIDFLEMLKLNKIPMSICSGALRSEIELILHKAKIRSYFEEITSAEEVVRGKPDPQGFLIALKKLNKLFTPEIKSQDCVVIEDSHWGLEAAQNAKMHTIAVTNSYDAHELQMAEKVAHKLSDIKMSDLQNICR